MSKEVENTVKTTSGDFLQELFGFQQKLNKAVTGNNILAKLRLNNGDNIYLICFAVYFLYTLMRTSVITLPSALIVFMNNSVSLFFIVLWMKILVFDIRDKKDFVRIIIPQILGMWVAVASVTSGQFADLGIYYMMLIGARNVDFRKIALTALYIAVPVLVALTLLASFGVIKDLLYIEAGTYRHSFGIIYPTDYGAHWFFAACLWFWLRKGKLRWYDICIFLALSGFLFVMCKAKTDGVCIVLLAVAGLLLNIKPVENAVFKLKWLWISSFALFALLSFALCLTYLQWSSVWDFINTHINFSFSLRFKFGRDALSRDPFTLFGTLVIERGNGGDVRCPSFEEYTFIDNSYVKVYIRAGVIVFVGLIALLTRFLYKRAAAKDAAALVMMTVIAVNCVMAHHLVDFSYNVPLLMMFAYLDAPGGISEILTGKEKTKIAVMKREEKNGN